MLVGGDKIHRLDEMCIRDSSRLIVDLAAVRLPKSYGYSPLTDIQVLGPGRKGEVGTNELNKQLQASINPPAKDKKEITLNGILFREGEKVMPVSYTHLVVCAASTPPR